MAFDKVFLQPASPQVFSVPKRPGECRLGHTVRHWRGETLSKRAVVLLGIPDDRGVAIAGGRVGSAKGPEAIREAFYRLSLGMGGELGGLELWDAGNVVLAETQMATYERLCAVVSTFLGMGCRVVLLGGGHDLSLGSLRGFLAHWPDGVVINIDPHLDVRPPEADQQYSSGVAFRLLLENRWLKASNLIEFGTQAECNAPEHFQWLKKQKVRVVLWKKVIQNPAKELEKALAGFGKKALAVSFDCDSLSSADAPGVSALNPLGFQAREAYALMQALAKKRQTLRLLEFMETNPTLDPKGHTATLAARLLYHFLCVLTHDKLRQSFSL